MKRLAGLDQLRGLAVLLMLIFHFTYDHWLFGYNQLDFRQGFWFGLPRLIVFIFLWCVGASLVLAHGQSIQWQAYLRRLGKLTGLALLISLITYWLFPKQWIYFGTIHCIAAVSLMALPFLRYPRAIFPAIGAILIGQYLLGYDIAWVSRTISRPSMDFIPPYPWFWVTLLGMGTGRAVLSRWPEGLQLNFFRFLGQQALPIYLLHQPLFYALFSLIAQLQKM